MHPRFIMFDIITLPLMWLTGKLWKLLCWLWRKLFRR